MPVFDHEFFIWAGLRQVADYEYDIGFNAGGILE